MHKQTDQCLLCVRLNIAPPHFQSHRHSLSVSSIEAGDRLDIIGVGKNRFLSGCSGGMKSPGEGGDNRRINSER